MSPMLSRRTLIAALAASPALAALPALAADDKVSLLELAVPGPIPDIALGKPDAPVKVYEYASMTCPHCARFAKDVFPGIKEKYIDTGKVLWTMREFPLDPRATAAFMLARCVAKDAPPEKYYTMLDVLFSQQESWAFVNDAKQVLPALFGIAKQSGFTQEQFQACLKDQALYAGVNAVKERGSSAFGIDGTPTFFINGIRKGGEITVDEFSKIVDPFLKS
ncbi:DsbA family protein [Labrys sp. KB_33_2]|uniref:DsbA family protein n=1 Tax=unclassified Labrys (in: a-proteobacteria) TaxID=2688601 RepID=UPI003EBA681A